ncbi:MAG TPA: hypothetical protein VN696_03390 [Pyrinomonadaceae bacterium]|nr:hypothetical protein [Pyrinomonadaceae bacterium]
MKNANLLFTLLVLCTASFSLSCSNPGNNSANVDASPSPTPITSPTPEPPRSGSLVDAVSSGDISYQLSGAGDNLKMNLTVRDKSERVWEVKIEAGTKLEPSESGVQQMVITKEYEVHLEPHEHHDIEIEVSCLDINKEAPSNDDKAWRIKRSQQLATFINCVNGGMDALERTGEIEKSSRGGLLQFALWKARGATRDDFIHLMTTYNGLSDEEAGKTADERDTIILRAIKGCESLVTLGP